jgi:signal transduction histidine kinase
MSTGTIATEEMPSLAEVVSIVHDLRNPLAAIHSSAEMLVRSSLSQPQVHRIARNMYSASIRMCELLEQWLDRSRSPERRFEVCNVRDLVAAAVAKIAVSAEFQAVRIVQDVPDRLLVALDQECMRRVVVNLLVNALEAMPHGGEIHISAMSERSSAIIRIRDTGPGIAPEIKGRLFQPFATAGKPNGLGLGLAISRQAAMDHGGEIWAESSNRGTCFVIRLPETMPLREVD